MSVYTLRQIPQSGQPAVVVAAKGQTLASAKREAGKWHRQGYVGCVTQVVDTATGNVVYDAR